MEKIGQRKVWVEWKGDKNNDHGRRGTNYTKTKDEWDWQVVKRGKVGRKGCVKVKWALKEAVK